MTDELEISISQYLDGTLPESERAPLEARLAQDSEAAALLAEDRELTALLRSSPLPNVEWDRLAASISSAIDQHLEERVTRASWAMRMRMPAGLAAAASVLIAAGLAVHSLLRPAVPSAGIQPPPAQGTLVATLFVSGPAADQPDGPVVSQITVEAGGTFAKDSSLSPYADEMDSRPARVVIASGGPVAQPPLGFPY